MLDAGMSSEHFAMHVGCSRRAKRNLCIRFRTTGSTTDLPHRGRPHASKRGKDCCIINTHLCNRFQKSTATAANTPELHNKQISPQTVRNHLQENGLHVLRPYIRCILTQSHRQNRLNWACAHSLDTAMLEYRYFFRINQDFLYNVLMVRCVCTRRRNERGPDCCVLERDNFGGGVSVMVCAAIAHGYQS